MFEAYRTVLAAFVREAEGANALAVTEFGVGLIDKHVIQAAKELLTAAAPAPTFWITEHCLDRFIATKSGGLVNSTLHPTGKVSRLGSKKFACYVDRGGDAAS